MSLGVDVIHGSFDERTEVDLSDSFDQTAIQEDVSLEDLEAVISARPDGGILVTSFVSSAQHGDLGSGGSP